MPVDPHIAQVLEAMEATQAPAIHAGTPEAGRGLFVRMSRTMRAPEHSASVASTEDRLVPTPAGGLRARVYRPEGRGPCPTIVFFHGGGWVVGDLETHDDIARSLCHRCDAVVVSVDYRLAPEHPFPAAVEDAVEATLWASTASHELGGDSRLAVAGDSAGGNLAAVVTQRFRDTRGPALMGQLLIYPSVDVVGDYGSRSQNGLGYFLELPTMEWFVRHYTDDPATYADPRMSPLKADLDALPPAVVVTAEYDPLRDEGEAYAEALRAAGVPADLRRFDSMIHGFFDMGAVSPAAQAAIDESCGMFARLLHR